MRCLMFCLIALAMSVLDVAPAESSEAKVTFEQKCASCHTIGGGDRIGPDLHGVGERRSPEWLMRFIMNPDKLIAAKDEIAVRLFEKYNRIIMPNLRLQEAEARMLLDYIQATNAAIGPAPPPSAAAETFSRPEMVAPQSTILKVFLALSALIVAVFTWIGMSTRSPAEVDVHKAYRLRKLFFGLAAALLLAVLVVTIPRVPYALAGAKPDRVVHVAARQFDFVFSNEPIVSSADLGRVPTLARVELEAGALVEFRVTAIDVNHGFGVYGRQRQLIAQTQAMPGYVNRLLVRFTEPGQYKVFCLEYCAAGHHLMQSQLIVK